MKSAKIKREFVHVDCEWIYVLWLVNKDEHLGQKFCFCRKQRIEDGRIVQKRLEKVVWSVINLKKQVGKQ